MVITAVDGAGNTNSEEVRVNEPLNVVAPNCPLTEAEVLNGGQTVSASLAISTIEATIPTALEPSEPYVEQGMEAGSSVELEPGVTEVPMGVSLNEMGIDVSESLMGGGIEDETGGAFTVGQSHCFQPLQVGTASSSPVLVEDAVVYPNAGPDTDTVIRPTAFGTTIVEHLRGTEAPIEFSWAVSLEQGEELVKLGDGSVAVVAKEGTDFDPEEVPAASEPGLTLLTDANAQVDQAEHELVIANNEIEGEVSMVIAVPEVLTSEAEIVPGILQLVGANVVKAELPPNTVDEAKAIIIRANPEADPISMCAAAVAEHPEYADTVCQDLEAEGEEEGPEDVEDLQSTASTPNTSLNATILSYIAHYENVSPNAGAQASSSGGVTKSQKKFCRPNRRKPECRAFMLNGLTAAEMENVLYNVPEGSNGTLANAFRHAFWVALMHENEDYPKDGLAWAIMHEENQWKSNKAQIARESKMDILNNFVGYVRHGLNTLNSCEVMREKSKDAHYLTGKRNPFKWAKNNGYQYFLPVFRKLVDNARSTATGLTVLPTGKKCKDFMGS